ncbi:diadenylate cyclase CdaA [Spirochaetia bacterium 38H-sp]|uniref:Diadenylate cyclase n=1 Tax=Rarispira pelagica TaxID=3141764 RepID=A0ABU9UDR2_9SPIR
MLEGLSYIWQNILVPLLDIAALSFLIFKVYEFLVATNSLTVLKGLLLVAFVYAVAFLLNLPTLKWILGFIAPGVVVGVFVVFQPELRKIFTQLGQGLGFRSAAKAVELEAILNAMELLSDARRGALIVLARNMNLKNILDTGIRLDAELSSTLLVTIFGHDTPLHDGAVIVDNGRIVAASCYLPLSDDPGIKKSFGARHRAALGLAEQTDAIVLVVSEETGALSVVYSSSFIYNTGRDEIAHIVSSLFKKSKQPQISEKILDEK